MKKTSYSLSTITILITLFFSACSVPPAAPVSTPEPVNNIPAQAPTVEVQAPSPEPTIQTFAPACQADVSCTAPDIQEKPVEDSICLSKIPWQNFLVPEGTVFEYQPKEGDPKLYPLVCKPTGEKQDGKIWMGCHGAQLWQYNVKVTSPSCGSTTLQSGTTSCAAGEGYDVTNNCCAPITSGDTGSVIINVNLGGCP